MSKKENLILVTGSVGLALSLSGCDKEANIDPKLAALQLPRSTPTVVVEENIDSGLPAYMKEGISRAPQINPTPSSDFDPIQEQEAVTPTVVYESSGNSIREEAILRETKEELHFRPDPKLNLDIMHITERERENLEMWRDLIEKQAEYYGWDANLAAAMMIAESGGVNGLVNDQLDAVGLWGILANHNGSPDIDTLQNPFTNGTWHFAKMVDLCKKQGRSVPDAIIGYGGWEEEIEPAINYRNDVLRTAGYMDPDGDILIPISCERIEEVPIPPLQSEVQVELPY